MATINKDLGATDISFNASTDDTLVLKNVNSRDIKITTATGLTPQGTSESISQNGTKSYTVGNFPSGSNPKIIFTWNEVGADGMRTGTINPG